MKNSILFLVIVSTSLLSCGSKNGASLTDKDKEIIKSEIAPLMNQIVQNSESGNIDKAIEPYSNKPEFLSISNGQVSDYSKFVEGNEQYFEAMESQEFTETLMSYTFIDKEIVIVTWGGSALAKMKDGQHIKVDPFAASLIFNKSDGNWKVVYNHESGVFAQVVNDSTKIE